MRNEVSGNRFDTNTSLTPSYKPTRSRFQSIKLNMSTWHLCINLCSGNKPLKWIFRLPHLLPSSTLNIVFLFRKSLHIFKYFNKINNLDLLRERAPSWILVWEPLIWKNLARYVRRISILITCGVFWYSHLAFISNGHFRVATLVEVDYSTQGKKNITFT